MATASGEHRAVDQCDHSVFYERGSGQFGALSLRRSQRVENFDEFDRTIGPADAANDERTTVGQRGDCGLAARCEFGVQLGIRRGDRVVALDLARAGFASGEDGAAVG